jgi:hypothetical protein
MSSVNACPAEFYELGPKRFVGSKVELALAVVSQVLFSRFAGLKAVGTNYPPCRDVLNNEVIANRIKFVFIVTGNVGGLQSFVQFQVEYFETQAQSCSKLFIAERKPGEIGSMAKFEASEGSLPLL